jgi:septal ring factor EnvC (AmiA/AmiB activator)
MRSVVMGLLLVPVLAAWATIAQSSTVVAQATSQSDQLFACQQKINQLNDQLRPLQTKLASLRAERKGVSHSGGEVARFKLANLDQEISQISKQMDGVNGQITAEKKRCDDIAHNKPSNPPAAATTPPPSKPRRP